MLAYCDGAAGAGVIGETGGYVDELDWTRKMGVDCDWMRRPSESRSTWETARCDVPLPRE